MHPVLFHIGAILIPSYGASAAVGVLLALFLAQRTARVAGLNPAHVWNLCVCALFAALIAQRLLLVVINLRDLRSHPSWLLALAMVHHPLLAAIGSLAGAAVAFACARWQKLPLLKTADALAAPLALGLAFEQLGALLAGSGYGTATGVRWAAPTSIHWPPYGAARRLESLFIPSRPMRPLLSSYFPSLCLSCSRPLVGPATWPESA